IPQEFSNPLVRPHIAVLSEDSGDMLNSACQGQKWHKEINANLAGPMVRHDHKDYFVNEPALVRNPQSDTTSLVLPTRWFLRNHEIWARVQYLYRNPGGDSLLIDMRSGECDEIPLNSFFASYVDIKDNYHHFGIPDPDTIIGVARSGDWSPESLRIDECQIECPNPWRKIAAGKRVIPVPIWFYCDDTSGNVSKKWNKHNSLLFTLAGLAPEKIHLLYNIHFLATSNTTSPLEMVEKLVEMIQYCSFHS
ncbi:hypothetical protein F5879DRAFT_814024, partial [Lentinula edodes]